jgi:hypothetical protein
MLFRHGSRLLRDVQEERMLFRHGSRLLRDVQEERMRGLFRHGSRLLRVVQEERVWPEKAVQRRWARDLQQFQR